MAVEAACFHPPCVHHFNRASPQPRQLHVVSGDSKCKMEERAAASCCLLLLWLTLATYTKTKTEYAQVLWAGFQKRRVLNPRN